MTTIWSDFPKGGWEAIVQESGLEQRNRSRRYGWWSSRWGIRVGKSTFWVLCNTKLLTKQLKSPHTMILAAGWRISALSILDDTALTTEQDDDGKQYKNNMKVVECRRAKRKHTRLRVLDVVMWVGFTESKDVRVVLEHKWWRWVKIPLKPLTLV